MPEDTKRDKLVEALKANLGSRAAIRGLVRYDDIDIQDLDCVTTDTEVEASIRDALGLLPDDQSVKVKSIRQFHAGTQRATVRLKSLDAQSLAKRGRIKIGWVNARVKIKATATRCFRCLGYGHTKHTCVGVDRSDSCSLCGSKDHKAGDCSSPPKCVACSDLKEPTDHYPGSGKCTAYRAALVTNKKTISESRKSGHGTDTPALQHA